MRNSERRLASAYPILSRGVTDSVRVLETCGGCEGDLVYALHARDAGLVKIGKADRLADRALDIQVHSPLMLALYAAYHGGFGLERYLHRKFRALRRHGEWFSDEALREIPANGEGSPCAYCSGTVGVDVISQPAKPPGRSGRDKQIRIAGRIAAIEMDAINDALRRCGGDVKGAAGILGISYRTIYRRLNLVRSAGGLRPVRTRRHDASLQLPFLAPPPKQTAR